MLFSRAISLAAALSLVSATPAIRRYVSSTAPRKLTSPLPAADYSVPITASVPRSKAKQSLLQTLRESQAAKAGSNFTTVLAGSDFDEEYLTNVKFGAQEFMLIIDTGSSDTWAPQVGYACFNLENKPVSQSQCAFGTAGFDTNASTTFRTDPGTNFNIEYADGEFLSGTVGFETVTVGNMAVANQEIGVVNKAAWDGDGFNSGLIGFASPNLTFVFNGTNPNDDDTQLPYNPFFYSAVQQGLVSHPFFSVALNRGSFAAENSSDLDPNLGFIAFGGIAPVEVTDAAVTVPIQGYNAATFTPENGTDVTYFYYAVDVERMSFTGNDLVFGTTNNIILDSGTTLDYVPTDVADAFAAAFDPPAIKDDDFGVYTVVCSATVPEFTVTIGGVSFTVDPADNLFPLGIQDDEGNDLCASGTFDGGPSTGAEGNVFILGDTFLHNVVATFNIETDEITISQRAPYTSESNNARRRAPASVRRRNV
ncbi:aspartic peptidase domain-containing protein [Lentinula detonsa]|uniref:Aspartic peptidase domain-containing protein n=1 Tax=Lentinula detonsa TaxID=2804962 RepID=A0AA38Q9X3_9AGAR|nr:aspartic peptidase domain-containing protein [Lentinula detonsa]